MKKSFVASILSSLIVVGGITLGVSAIGGAMPLGTVYAEDGIGDGYEEGTTEDTVIYNTDDLGDDYEYDYERISC